MCTLPITLLNIHQNGPMEARIFWPVLITAVKRRSGQFLVILVLGVSGALIGAGPLLSFILGAASSYVPTIADDMRKIHRRMRIVRRGSSRITSRTSTIGTISRGPATHLSPEPSSYKAKSGHSPARRTPLKRVHGGKLLWRATLIAVVLYVVLNLILWQVFHVSRRG